MLKIEMHNDLTIVRFKKVDRFNALITEPVKEELKGLFNKPNIKLILNLEGIKFVDSSGFGVFLSIMKTASNNQGSFKLCNISSEVMQLFKLLQLHNVFSISEDLPSCIASFK